MIGSTNETGRRIDAWMEAEAPLRAPVEILETVFATTSQASQRRAFPAFVGPRFGRSGRPLAMVLVALALVGLLIFGAVMVGGSRHQVAPSPSPSPVAVPTVTPATIEARIPIPGAVPGMAFGSATTADAVWVTSNLAVVRIDPTSNATLTVDLPEASAISGLATSAAGVFVADRPGNAVYRIDPASNTVVGRIEVVGGPSAIVADDSSVWALLSNTRSIARIGTATNTVETTFAAPANARTIVLAYGDLWVATFAGQMVRIDPMTGAVLGTIAIPPGVGPCGGTPAAAELWTGCFTSPLLGRVDAATNTYLGDVEAGGVVGGMVSVDDRVWVAEPPDGPQPGRLVSIDPVTVAIDRILTLGPTDDPDIPVVLAGSFWIPIENQNVVLRVRLPVDPGP